MKSSGPQNEIPSDSDLRGGSKQEKNVHTHTHFIFGGDYQPPQQNHEQNIGSRHQEKF